MATSKKRLSDNDWRPHESAIRRMIVEQNKSREETRLLLKDDGFLVTQGQLEFILKKLGIRKKVPKKSGDDFWQFIGYRVEKRKRHGKASEVILNNQILNPAKVRREISRHQPTSLRRFTQAPISPRTPYGLDVSIYTPVTTPLRPSWPSSLPWLRFQATFSQGNSLFRLPKSIKTGRDMMAFEQRYITVNELLHIPHVLRTRDAFNLTAEIEAVMPETYENENIIRAQSLTLGGSEEYWHECIKIAFYKLSNHIDGTMAVSWQWHPIAKLLLSSGITKSPIRIDRFTDITVAAAVEKLFQCALNFSDSRIYRGIKSVEGEIIDWLLSSGQNPDYPLLGSDGILMTPLQQAAKNRSSELMIRLLDFGAQPNLTYDEFETSLRSVILNYREFGEARLDLVKRLLKEAASTSVNDTGYLEDALHLALMAADTSDLPPFYLFGLVDALIQNGADVLQQRQVADQQQWFIEKFNAIGQAAGFKSESKAVFYVLLLLEKAQLDSLIPRARLVTTDVVLLAAARGNLRVLQMLKDWNVNINDAESRGISALHVAGYYGHTSTCSLLLKDRVLAHGQGHQKQVVSPLHLVSHKGDLVTIDILCRYGDDGCTTCQKPLIGSKEPKYQSMGLSAKTTMLDHGAAVIDGQVESAPQPGWWNITQRILQNNDHGILHLQQCISMIEAAGLGCNRHSIQLILAQASGYDPRALCISVLYSGAIGTTTIRRLLRSRPPSKLTMDLEASAIGIAAWHNELELLDLLLKEFQTPALAVIPRLHCNDNIWNKSAWNLYEVLSEIFNLPQQQKYPFWHFDCILGSPVVLAIWSPESLQRMLNHGYQPDRLTMSVAARLGYQFVLRMLVRYPRLLGGFENLHGPLSVAAQKNDLVALEILLNNGEDVNEDNRSVERGRSPLQAAIEISNLQMIDLLLKTGADVNAPAAYDRGATALQFAAITGRLGIARTLVDLGAAINAAGAKIGGRTALEGAAEYGRIDMIQYFLTQGAQTIGEGRLQYLRAIRYAEKEGHIVAANLLRDYREWTPHDHALWGDLKSLSKKECEEYREEFLEKETHDMLEKGEDSSEKQPKNNGRYDLPMMDLIAGQMDDGNVDSRVSGIVGGTITELEDLEMLTRDNLEFWSGV